ncbi:hypothetical protein [Campylobacter pinnipediorum]|uniref:hypothetical protein n=1 Tax=Campylobacter pinnipediorum TaxID=1965231 RepID=UPI0018E96754|nr:hypothetical protein [Campylobacter pinnipediorum]
MAFDIGIPMIIASFAGNHFGSMHTIKSNGEIVKKILVVTVLLTMIAMGYKVFN